MAQTPPMTARDAETRAEILREPKNDFQRIVRALAENAMAVTHHDAGQEEPGYIHEVQEMERRFSNLLRGYLARRSRATIRSAPDAE